MKEVKLILEAGERGIVGNMKVTNIGDSLVELSVEGDGPVLRGKQIINPEDAISPALKIYQIVTDMYVRPGAFEENQQTFLDMSRELMNEVPSTTKIMAGIGTSIIAGDYRSAHEKCFDLMEYEDYLENVATGKIKDSGAKPQKTPENKVKKNENENEKA